MIAAFLSTFILTVIGFLTTTAVLGGKASKIREHAETITANGVPTIETLSVVRTTLRHLELTVDDHLEQRVFSNRLAHEPASIEDDRKSLRDDWAFYLKLPAFRGKRRLAPVVAAAIEQLDGKLEKVLQQLRSGDALAAKAAFDDDLKQLFELLDGYLYALTRINTAGTSDAAAAIDSIQRDLRGLSATLNVLCGLFGVLAAIVAVRLLTRYTRTTESQIANLELFSGRVAHDIRGPLSSAGLAVTFAEQTSSDPKTKEILSRASRTLQRTSQLVDGLLLLAQVVRSPDAGARADVRGVIDDVVEELRPLAVDQDIELETRPMRPSTVACSAGVLGNMVGNLIGNAIKYMGDASMRRVVVSTVDLPEAVRIIVEDTGPGIPAAAQATVFEPYARAAPSGVTGLGLGLATVKRLAEVLGGNAGLESREGSGSLLWIELPKPAE